MGTPALKKLKKGELLFNEGDPSKAMYYVQSGIIRLFKRKGSSSVELGVIHRGEVIGEMGFLDGGNRSASAEAMHDVDLMEITNNGLLDQLNALPKWLMVLLKTVVNRLRSANNKIRQLENTTSGLTYGSEGVITSYQFLTIYDVMKICISILLAGREQNRVSLSRIMRYANQIMGIHLSKVSEMLDILERVELVKVDRRVSDKVEVDIHDIDQIDLFVNHVNEENLREHSKKTTFTIKAVLLMGYIVKHLGLFPQNSEGISEVNLAKIQELEKQSHGGKEPFRLDDTIGELVKAKLASEMHLKDSTTVTSKVRAKEILKMFRIQKILKEIETLNEKKREHSQRGTR